MMIPIKLEANTHSGLQAEIEQIVMSFIFGLDEIPYENTWSIS